MGALGGNGYSVTPEMVDGGGLRWFFWMIGSTTVPQFTHFQA
jgi:hypothetical protein